MQAALFSSPRVSGSDLMTEIVPQLNEIFFLPLVFPLAVFLSHFPRTFRNKGSKRVVADGLKFYPKPFGSEEPSF